MNKKKLLSTVLCGTMLLAAMTGCSQNSAAPSSSNVNQKKTSEASNIKKEETKGADKADTKRYEKFITVDVFDSLSNYQGIQSGWFAEIVKEKFNMELNIIAPNVAGGGDTLFQTRSAAGELGDLIITNANGGRLQDLVTAGLVTDMTELIKDKKHLQQYTTAIEHLQDLVNEEGVWAIPSDVSAFPATTPSEGLDLTYGPYVRWDAYKAVGYPQIKTLEDLLPVLKQMQEAMPTSDSGQKTYAFSFFKDWDGNMMNNAKQPTCLYGYDELGFVLAKADGADYQSIIDDDSMYVRVLKLFYEANQMGLVDPESTTQNYDILFKKYQDGAVLYSPWPWLGQSAYNTLENKGVGKGFMVAPIEDMQIFSYGCNPYGNAAACMMIGSKAEEPERLADFIDWLYSPEGVLISTSGPEGLTWEEVNGRPELTDFGKKAFFGETAVMPEEWGGGTWRDGTSQLNFRTVSMIEVNPETGFPYMYTLWDSVLELNATTLDKDWQEHMSALTTLEYLESHDAILVAPGSDYATPPEDSKITTLRGQCKASIVDYSWKMIFAKDEAEFNSLLKAMQDTVNGLGYEEVLAVDMQNAKDQNAARVAALEASQK